MQVKTFTVNPLQENSYLVYDETCEAVMIDAGFLYEKEKEALLKFIDNNNLKLVRIINTHLHFDHQFGNKFLFDNFGLKPEAHAADEHLLEEIKTGKRIFGFPVQEDSQELGRHILEGEMIKFGNSTFKALYVPGHTPGHLAFYSSEYKKVFVGDVLFRGSVGRTDFPGGDHAQLIRSIQKELLVLPDDTVVYSGHGPTTTIGEEKSHNPYL